MIANSLFLTYFRLESHALISIFDYYINLNWTVLISLFMLGDLISKLRNLFLYMADPYV